MSDLLVFMFYAATYGVLSYLSWCEWTDRQKRRRSELRRLDRINTQPPRFDGGARRNDPSPTPRKKTNA